MGINQDKISIKKSGVSMILDSRESQNKSMMFYLKKKMYAPEVQYALPNILEEKKDGNDKK